MSLFAPGQTWTPPPTPFAGFIGGKPAQSAPHVLVSGVSGSGKSRRVLGPGILMWRGPVVAVSSKPDLIDMTLGQRAAMGGADHTYVLDLSGEVPDDALPPGVRKVVVDPTALIQSDDDALDMATILMQSGAAGAGGGSNHKSGDPFWENVATAPLAALLRAASLMTTSEKRGIDWAREAVSRMDDDDQDGEPMDLPSWTMAMRVNVGDDGRESLIGQKLSAAYGLDGKMRDSIQVTMESALAPWLRSTVAGCATDTVFTPALLENPRATLYIVAPATGVAAGAAVSAVDFISKRWRANQSERVKLPRLLLVVDELTNTMPWPKLPTVVTESRAMGIHLLVAVQATSQFAKRYGKEGMDELREVFPATLILVGAPEKTMLENAAWWAGKSERQKTSIDHANRQSQSSERVATLDAVDLLPRDIDHGRLLRGSRPGESGTVNEAGLLVELHDISEIQFRASKAA